jgi:hypothetical protein
MKIVEIAEFYETLITHDRLDLLSHLLLCLKVLSQKIKNHRNRMCSCVHSSEKEGSELLGDLLDSDGLIFIVSVLVK